MDFLDVVPWQLLPAGTILNLSLFLHGGKAAIMALVIFYVTLKAKMIGKKSDVRIRIVLNFVLVKSTKPPFAPAICW